MTMEIWSRDRAAAELGISPDSVGRVLARRGYRAVGREAGSRGQSLYNADDVRAYADDRHEWRGRATTRRKAS